MISLTKQMMSTIQCQLQKHQENLKKQLKLQQLRMMIMMITTTLTAAVMVEVAALLETQ